MLPIKSFDPGGTPNGGQIALNAADPGARILFYNNSIYDLRLDFLNGNQDILYAWEARWWPLDGNTDQIDWTIDSTLASTGAPSSRISGTLYAPGEELPGTYPISLIRQANVGNTVNTVGNDVTTAIQNDNKAPGTSIIEATPSDASASTWSADNKGNLLIKGDNAGVLTTLLQLVAGASPLMSLMGKIQVDQAGHFAMPNNITMRWFDNGGIARPMFVGDNTNTTIIISMVSGGNVEITDQAGAIIATFNQSSGLTINSGSLTVPGKAVFTPQPVQSIANNGTISFTGSVIHVTSAAAVTGVIMQAGTVDGQMCVLLNDGSFSLTFAAAGSNVGSGSNNVLNGGRNTVMFWNSNISMWENHGGN